MAKRKPKVGQFLSVTFSERGGGERVQSSLYRLFKASIYTLKKTLKGKEYKEVGSERDKKLLMHLTKV